MFELSPEVEQTHDPDRHGVSVVIEVTRLQANAGAGRNFSDEARIAGGPSCGRPARPLQTRGPYIKR